MSIRGGASAIELSFGGTPAPGLVIAGTLQGGTAPTPTIEVGGLEGESRDDRSLSSIGILADYYIDPHDGFHVQALLGFGVFVDEDDDTDDPSGLTLGAGAGYEWWVGDQWGLGLLGRLTYAPLTIGDVSHSVLFPALLGTVTHH